VPQLRVRGFGAPAVYVAERLLTPADWTFAKPRELLFYLLTNPASSKQQIGLDLWPAASTGQLRNSFHTALHHLRRALGHPGWIRFEHGGYDLDRTVDCSYDVHAFESGLAAARRAHGRSPVTAIPLLQAAVDRYAGDFLPDLDSAWARQRQDELRLLHQDGLLLLGRLLQAAGRPTDAAETYRRAIAHDPLSETAHRELMRCELKRGERGHAIRQYERLVRCLRDELDAPPAAETTALYQRLRRGDADV
jgi:two-component SAPR family response regulator